MTFVVSGINMVPYIAKGGLKWQRSDVDGPNAGRMANGDLQRDRVASKIRWDVTCRPLTPEELAKILSAIKPEQVAVRYLDPETNRETTGTFYANNFPVELYGIVRGGKDLWTGLTFPLIQI